MNGQGQNPACPLFANGQVTLRSSEVGEAGLEMQGNRVVDCGADFGPVEMGLEPVPVIGLDHILVKDMPRSIGRGNHLAIQFGGFEKGTVVVGSLPPRLLESGQLRKLLEKKCGLKRVHPEIETHLVVEVILAAEARHNLPPVMLVSDGQPVLRGTYFQEIARLLGAPKPQFSPPDEASHQAGRATSDKRISNRRLQETLPMSFQYKEGRLPRSRGV